MKMLCCMAFAVLMIPASLLAQTFPSPTFNVLTLQTPLSGANGGTGVSNGSNTLTLGGNLATSGAFGITLTATGATNLTLPTTGTLLTNTSASAVYAPIISPTFTGTVTIPSGASISGYLTTAVAASTYAPLTSPAFTGTPTAPTATAGTSTTQLATTAYVATSYAPLASPTFTGTATTAALTSTGNFTPSQTNGIVGTTTNNNANAGSVGEFISATASSVSLTTAVTANITSMSLTAGDWDISAGIFVPGSTANLINVTGGVSTTSATFGGVGTYFQYAGTAVSAFGDSTPIYRVSIASTTTVYCVVAGTFSTGTATASCLLRARRVR